ncbi:hypothetical protein NDA01_20890 [Trichocoleus desertorum AS-A10]|uniref:hypothetical protein n=1 Tax=Trichocoleus desertorum TaxID=1481672 RepID=UPI003297714E
MDVDRDRERCLESLTWAIEQLQGKVDIAKLDKIAELIIQAMTGPWRYFHTPEHIFEVGDSGDAIEVLAALFHDLVYVQVDQGISVNISRFIAPFIKETPGHLAILDAEDLPSDRSFSLVLTVFGFAPSQRLSPMAGQNEFLSAVIAAKSLESLLSYSHLAQIAACIEATVPFRPKSAEGITSDEALYRRLLSISQEFDLGWTEAETLEITKRSVRLANRDVENFAFPSSAHFLDNTWNLIPETNHDLKNTNAYKVQGYRLSIQKMEGFMNFLKPEVVFRQFHGEPNDETYQRLINNTAKNLEVARLYLGAKLVSIAIIEALAFRIGRDVPISTMMGELPSSGFSTVQLEHFLPKISSYRLPETPIEHDALELLEKGRSIDSFYDVKNSPTATFIVKSIGFAALRQLLKHAKAFFQDEISAEEFLSYCDPVVVETVTKGVIQLFESRKLAMQQESLNRHSAIAS